MKITIITVGKLKEKYLKQGIAEYTKRLSAYANIELVEVPDEKAPENLSAADMDIVKQKEGERILAKVSPDTYVITLEINGKQLTSEQLATHMDQLATYGRAKLPLLSADRLGLAPRCYQEAIMPFPSRK